MSSKPSLVFVHGSWHRPICYRKIITPLETQHGFKCIAVGLPSTDNNPNATFTDDIDAVRSAINSETSQGRNVIVIAHSFGGMVANSAIKGLTVPRSSKTTSTSTKQTPAPAQNASSGHVVGLVLIASGFTITGWAFMDPFRGKPPPLWRADEITGYADLVGDPREYFYHDVPAEEAEYWISQLSTQSLKTLYEGREYAYAGWKDVPTWYVGTTEDKGFPVILQRVQVEVARRWGGEVYHVEMESSHSPFLSMPEELVDVLLEVVETVAGQGEMEQRKKSIEKKRVGRKGVEVPAVRLGSPNTWVRFGVPVLIGRAISFGIIGYTVLSRLWGSR